MSVLLVDHTDLYQKQIALELLKLKLPISAIVSDRVNYFDNKNLPPKIKIFDIYDFYYADRIRQLSTQNTISKKALSSDDIKQFFELESQFLKISDRLAFTAISVHQRLELYYQLLLFWLNFFKENGIKLIIFAQTPHTGFDNIIFFIACQYQIKTIIVSPTSIGTNCLLIEDYRQCRQIPANFKNNRSKTELISLINPRLYAQAYGEGSWQRTGQNINAKVLTNNQNNVVLRSLKRVVSTLHSQPIQTFRHLFRRSRNSIFVFNRPLQNWQELLLTASFYLKRKSLITDYERLTTEVDDSRKFVFFALHYQPERTTMPEGGVFEDQFLALNILSNSLPKDWIIYVKEHPREFSLNDVRTKHFRDSKYYSRLLKIPQVRLVPIKQNSQELIKKSQFTASIQGTVGWESLQQHKPTMVFANSWYGACSSSYQVSSVDECQNAVKAIKNSTSADVELDVLRFLVYIQDQLVEASFYHQQAISSDVPYEQQLKNLAIALNNFYDQNCTK